MALIHKPANIMDKFVYKKYKYMNLFGQKGTQVHLAIKRLWSNVRARSNRPYSEMDFGPFLADAILYKKM